MPGSRTMPPQASPGRQVFARVRAWTATGDPASVFAPYYGSGPDFTRLRLAMSLIAGGGSAVQGLPAGMSASGAADSPSLPAVPGEKGALSAGG